MAAGGRGWFPMLSVQLQRLARQRDTDSMDSRTSSEDLPMSSSTTSDSLQRLLSRDGTAISMDLC